MKRRSKPYRVIKRRTGNGRTALVVSTPYWRPGTDFLDEIVRSIRGVVRDGDILTISEKAISTAMGNLIDESVVRPGLLARILARFWMRYVWGYALGRLCHLKERNIRRLRFYPAREGGIHKETVLRYAGFLHALQWGSEGGIDASNLPYSYVSLPLKEPWMVADMIRRYVRDRLGRRVTVMIVDTDKTYSMGGFHFTPRPTSVRDIHQLGGFMAYLLGRALKLRRRSTPIAIAGSKIPTELALDIAEESNRLRGSGAGMTVWDMAETFGVSITEVTWEMLDGVEHRPIVIVRLRVRSG